VKYAEPLNERRGQHAERLRELREEALPYTEGDRAQDRREHPLALELEGARALVAHHSLPEVRAQGNSEYWLRTFTLKVDQLQLEVSARSTWRFSSLRDQWEHDQLARLQAELTRFFDSDPYLGAAASVARRIDEIQRMRSAEDEAAASGDWDAARAEIRRSPRYGGLELAPQQGLVPLGVDPDSGLYEFWHVASGARPVPSADPAPTSPWMLEEDTGLILVLIPGGTYRLGAQASNPTGAHFDPLAREDEVVQEVELWPYFLSKHEFTLAQWQRATGRLPAASYGPCWPACDVTWDECVELLARLGLQLPSEAQWEAAARGGTETPWWCGSTSASLAGCANIAERTTQAYYGRLPWIYESELEDPWYKLAPVDAVRANSFGLLHVAGNVLEWCADVYAPAGWTTRQGDGLRLAPPESRRAERVARGGAWQRPARSARSAERERFTSETKLPYLGLRPARPLDEHRVMLEHLSGAR
jgi:formylglycine-generating enzyme required for sulfatase activity